MGAQGSDVLPLSRVPGPNLAAKPIPEVSTRSATSGRDLQIWLRGRARIEEHGPNPSLEHSFSDVISADRTRAGGYESVRPGLLGCSNGGLAQELPWV